jgi:cysteine synthase
MPSEIFYYPMDVPEPYALADAKRKSKEDGVLTYHKSGAVMATVVHTAESKRANEYGVMITVGESR